MHNHTFRIPAFHVNNYYIRQATQTKLIFVVIYLKTRAHVTAMELALSRDKLFLTGNRSRMLHNFIAARCCCVSSKSQVNESIHVVILLLL